MMHDKMVFLTRQNSLKVMPIWLRQGGAVIASAPPMLFRCFMACRFLEFLKPCMVKPDVKFMHH